MLWTLSSQTTGISLFLSHLPFPASLGHSKLTDITIFQNKTKQSTVVDLLRLIYSHGRTFSLSNCLQPPPARLCHHHTLKFLLLQSPHTPVASANGSYSVLMLILCSTGNCGDHTLFLELSTSRLSFCQRHLVFDRGFPSRPSASLEVSFSIPHPLPAF